MKPKSLAVTLLGCAILGVAALLPVESSGQAGGADEAQTQQLLAEITAQQTAIAENQTQIEEKITAIAEEVRLARIYAGRTGGKAK